MPYSGTPEEVRAKRAAYRSTPEGKAYMAAYRSRPEVRVREVARKRTPEAKAWRVVYQSSRQSIRTINQALHRIRQRRARDTALMAKLVAELTNG